jgi:hypothetical protein
MTTDPLFAAPEPHYERDGPPPPVRCGYPLDHADIPKRRCQKRGPHQVLIGKHQHQLIRRGICEGHLKELLSGLAEAGLNYELL